jgi:hypothetical protein
MTHVPYKSNCALFQTACDCVALRGTLAAAALCAILLLQPVARS